MGFIKDLIIFILSLCVLVVIHELGHFITAKIFKVYCREFSIGMGPVLFKIKKPEWETQYSLRALPIGGFVSMVGEEAGDSEGAGGHIDPSKKKEEDLTDEDRRILALPKERRLDGIKKWKRLIIMSAGVIMNVVLAFFLFAGQGISSKVVDEGKNYVAVEKIVTKDKDGNEVELDGLFASAGYVEGSTFKSGSITFIITDKNGNSINETKKNDNITSAKDVASIFSYLNDYDHFLPYKESDHAVFSFVCINPSTNEEYEVTNTFKVVETDAFEGHPDYETCKYYYDLSMFDVKYYGRHRTFFEVIKFAGTSTVDGALLIYKGLASLFTQGLKNVGGPIAMFQMSSQATSLGMTAYLYLWGVISINLAIMNFLPIPGLDGWHFLVLIVEGITRKEFPSKVKNIVSMIGLGLLFGLMIIITLKDVIGLFF